MTNKYGRALARWFPRDVDESKAATEFDSDELAELFPDANKLEAEKGEQFLRRVACMKYVVSPSRFRWMLEMAKKCLAAEDEADMEDGIQDVEEGVFSDEQEDSLVFNKTFYVMEDSGEDEEDSSEDEEDSSEDEEDRRHDHVENSIVNEVRSTERAIYGAAVKLNSVDLAKFLFDISVKYKGEDHDQLEAFGVYMSSELMSRVQISNKRIARLPWVKLPACIYQKTARWLKQLSVEALESFVLKTLERICSDLAKIEPLVLTKKLKNLGSYLARRAEKDIFVSKTLESICSDLERITDLEMLFLQSDSVEFNMLQRLISFHAHSAEKESVVFKTFECLCSKIALKIDEDVQCEFEFGSLLVLALVLQFKPEVLISVWPTFEENTEYRVQDKILFLAWVISQACNGDWIVGVFMWVRYLFPLLNSESNLSLKSRDVIMQVIARIGLYSDLPITLPCKDEVNLGIRNGERVVDPLTLEIFARAAFPADSERRKATKALRKGYHLLKSVALLASPGSEEAKQVSEQLIPLAVKAAGEGNSCLAKKAKHIFFWCLTSHSDSFKLWDDIYLENLDGSVFMLENLSVKWLKMVSRNVSILGPLSRTMESITLKNEKALASKIEASDKATLEKAQKYAKCIKEEARKYGGKTLGDTSAKTEAMLYWPRITAQLGIGGFLCAAAFVATYLH